MNWQEEFNQAITKCKKISDEIILLTKEDFEKEKEQNEHHNALIKNAPSPKWWIIGFVIIGFVFCYIIAILGYWEGSNIELLVYGATAGAFIGLIIYLLVIFPLNAKSNPECRYHRKMEEGLVLERERIKKTRYKLITQEWESAKTSAHKLQKSATYQQLKENNIGDKYNRGVLELDNLFQILIGKKQDKSKDTNGWLIAAGISVALLGGVAAATSSAVKSAGKDFGS